MLVLLSMNEKRVRQMSGGCFVVASMVQSTRQILARILPCYRCHQFHCCHYHLLTLAFGVLVRRLSPAKAVVAWCCAWST
ncbi:uncharacterized protein YALI1_C09137g [Yarrowia lipolytica]|uniref:Uncharacterized protein n=1 Tax=Yarrowia lipolytica TaxID=4952 RepID=A0A1D8N9Y5_YARLL|nr:hypothetical protein YALI1_C09137g [Yarrowia lipolytica]